MRVHLNNLKVGPAERRERAPRIAVFDTFAEPGQKPEHGNKVESIIRQSGGWSDAAVQNYHNSYDLDVSTSDVLEAGPDQFRKKLKKLTEQKVSRLYRATAENLKSIVEDENSTVQVINQSQSQSPGRIARPIIEQLDQDADLRATLRQVYNLPSNCHKRDLAEALVDDVNGTFKFSGAIHHAERIYLNQAKKAYEKGIVQVVTSGNLGQHSSTLNEWSVEVPKDYYRSIFANEFTTIVGAVDGRGTVTIRDDRAAPFSSVNAGAEFGMNGVNVGWETVDRHGDSDGTSFAAPQVTGVVAEMKNANPQLSVEEIEKFLERASVPVQGNQTAVGAGSIEPDRAIMLAEQSYFASRG